MAGSDKFGRIKQLMSTGKQKGYVLYDEVNDLLAEDYPGGRELDDLLTELDTAGVEILEEPKPEFDKKAEEAEEPLAEVYTEDGGPTPEASRELIANWDVPSWTEIVAGLHRPSGNDRR